MFILFISPILAQKRKLESEDVASKKSRTESPGASAKSTRYTLTLWDQASVISTLYKQIPLLVLILLIRLINMAGSH